MRRVLLILVLLLGAAGALFAQRMTEAQERERFETLLRYARTTDPPSRHTAHEEMVEFKQWIDPELLGRLSDASIQERQLFWWVLNDRRCRAAGEPALKMLPEAIERCRQAQIAAHEVLQLRRRMRKAQREGDDALADRLAGQIESERGGVSWNEIVQGDEVSILCAIVTQFGREKELKMLAELAVQSSMDDALAKGILDRHTRTHRDKPLPGGTEMWNTVYNAVWEGLRKLSQRALNRKTLDAVDKKLTAHFGELEKTAGIGPNQQAALRHYHAVIDALRKTGRNTADEDEEETDKPKETDDGVGIIRM